MPGPLRSGVLHLGGLVDLGMQSLLVFAIALAYATVGHGGASGYLALGAMLGIAPMPLRGHALILNLVVAGLAFLAYQRAVLLRFRLLGALLLGSVPCAYLGARYLGNPEFIRKAMALALLAAGARFLLPLWSPQTRADGLSGDPDLTLACGVGALLGLLSGVTGVGGGIYLSPLLLIWGWAGIKETALLSAAFIFVNSGVSLAGLAQAGTLSSPPPTAWLVAGALGALLGAKLGALRFSPLRLKQALSLILVAAGLKLGFF